MSYSLVTNHQKLHETLGAHSQFVFLGDAAGGAVSAVEAVLQVDDGLADQVVRAHQVPVVDLHTQARLHRECRFNFKASAEHKGCRIKC